MRKFKLIKTYPGSPELGHVLKEKDITQFSMYLLENSPEYWEKVEENIWWCVWKTDYLQEGVELFKAWTPYKIECVPATWETERFYFKTKEEAEEFILYQKPCLSYDDVCQMFGKSREFKNDLISFHVSEESLKGFVKSRI